jgi:predicted O-methyltransferase YrrM
MEAYRHNRPQDERHRPRFLIELLEEVVRRSRPVLDMLEIGSIRRDTPEHEAMDGHSTVHLGRFAAGGGHHFTTVDLDTTTCMRVLKAKGLEGMLDVVTSDGLAYLREQPDCSHDFIYLDAEDDAEEMFSLFTEAIRVIRPRGLIACDDCNDGVTKGRILRARLDRIGLPYRFIGLRILVVWADDLIAWSVKPHRAP